MQQVIRLPPPPLDPTPGLWQLHMRSVDATCTASVASRLPTPVAAKPDNPQHWTGNHGIISSEQALLRNWVRCSGRCRNIAAIVASTYKIQLYGLQTVAAAAAAVCLQMALQGPLAAWAAV
jgi:hypothetical protein